MALDLKYVQQSENSITIFLGDKICLKSNQILCNAMNYLNENPFIGFQEVVLAYHSLTIYYDLVEVYDYNKSKISPSKWVLSLLHNLPWSLFQNTTREKDSTRVIEIPVTYGCQDMDELSELLNLSQKEIVDLHTSTVYHVFMIGFLPGFPYLGILPEKLIAPRKEKPSLHIDKGSVAIAGSQTGVYPTDSPGGWFVLGKTKIELFDLTKPNPCYLQSGDRVKFIAI